MRRLAMGGLQGRGDPVVHPKRVERARYVDTGFGVVRIPPEPDALAYAVAGNIKDATPGLRINPLNDYAQDFVGWRLFRHAYMRLRGWAS